MPFVHLRNDDDDDHRKWKMKVNVCAAHCRIQYEKIETTAMTAITPANDRTFGINELLNYWCGQ